MAFKSERIQNGNEENSCVCNSPPSPISMLFLCSRLRNSLDTHNFAHVPVSLAVFQEDAGTDRHASSSATNFTTACTSASARTATYFIKMDTAAPVSVRVYVWIDSILIPHCNSHSWRATSLISVIKFHAAPDRQTFSCGVSYCFSKHRLLSISTGPLKISRLIPEYSYINSFVPRLASSTNCYHLQLLDIFFIITITREYIRKC